MTDAPRPRRSVAACNRSASQPRPIAAANGVDRRPSHASHGDCQPWGQSPEGGDGGPGGGGLSLGMVGDCPWDGAGMNGKRGGCERGGIMVKYRAKS